MMDLQAPALTFLPSFFLSSSPTSTSPFAVSFYPPLFALLPVSLSRRAECLPSSSSARVHEVGAIEKPSDQLNNWRSLFFFFRCLQKVLLPLHYLANSSYRIQYARHWKMWGTLASHLTTCFVCLCLCLFLLQAFRGKKEQTTTKVAIKNKQNCV